MNEDWKNSWCDESGCGSSGPQPLPPKGKGANEIKTLIERAREFDNGIGKALDETLVSLIDTLTYTELLRLKSIVDFYYNAHKGQ